MQQSERKSVALFNTALYSRYLESSPDNRQVGGDHYAAEFQHWDLVPTLNLPWQEGCAIKYLERCWKKGQAAQDLAKAIHYTEKLIQLVLLGVVPLKSTHEAYRAFHTTTYQHWISLQDLKPPTPELGAAQLKILEAWASWPFRESSFEGYIGPVDALIDIHGELVSYHEKVTEHLANKEKTYYSPVSQDDESSLDAEALRAYVAQAEDPPPPQQPQQEQPEQPAPQPDPQSVPASPKLVEVLRSANRQAFEMLLLQRSVSIPITVYRDLLEKYRRHDGPPHLNLSARLPEDGNTFLYTSFRDYAEPLLKVQVGLQALDEAIPNRQLHRTLIAMAAVSDGVQSMMHWLLTSTEGKHPAITDLLEQDEFRVAGYAVRQLIAQEAAAVFARAGISSDAYTRGVTASQEAGK